MINVEKQHNGSHLVSYRRTNGDLVKCVYYGYRAYAAIRKFNQKG